MAYRCVVTHRIGLLSVTLRSEMHCFKNYAIGVGKECKYEWYEYFVNEYGKENVHWNLNSIDDIWDDPRRMVGYTADEMASVLGDGWERGTYGFQGDGWKFLKKGDDISVFYHPEGGTHGGEYWGISSGETGKIKVVDPNTYIPRKDDHATIIYR